MNNFRKHSKEAIKNRPLLKAIDFGTGHALKKREETIKELEDYKELRKLSHKIRRKNLQRIEELLKEFKERAEKNGSHVYIVQDSEEANFLVYSILKKHDANFLIKSKSMTTEETGLNKYLKNRGIEVLETDLGEFIVQIAGERPSHLIAPALHKSRQDIARLFREKLGYRGSAKPEEIASFARKYLREKFFKAKAGLMGANFLVANMGIAVGLENEGNMRFVNSMPEILIIFAGIEKLVANFFELYPLLRILPVSATGQVQTSYVSFIGAPAGPEEIDGPKKVYFVLLQGKRMEIFKNQNFNEAMMCIRCGACSLTCPVYQSTGGHAYDSVYSGPIGVILTNLYGNLNRPDLAYACTLCGACNEICPVKIDLVGMILKLRKKVYKRSGILEKFLIFLWQNYFTSLIIQKISKKFLVFFNNFPFFKKWLGNFKIKT